MWYAASPYYTHDYIFTRNLGRSAANGTTVLQRHYVFWFLGFWTPTTPVLHHKPAHSPGNTNIGHENAICTTSRRLLAAFNSKPANDIRQVQQNHTLPKNPKTPKKTMFLEYWS
jgi:hypothetical protein